MSTSNQNNGKKYISNNNSATNTPSNTPVSSIGNSSNNQCSMQNNAPLTNGPKYGTLVPNRIFVGGISANTTEAELMQLFNNYGTVKAVKIIQDRAGVSKGYGFITFESEEEAKRLQRESENIVLRERKLNIAPAIKKQPFSRVFDASSPSTIAPGGPAQYFIPAGGVPFYQGGVTYYAQPPPQQPGDMNAQQAPVYQAPTVYPTQSAGPPQNAAYPPMVYPSQTIYMPQQFPYQPVPYDYNYHPNGNPQYIVGNQNAHQPPPIQMQSTGSPPRTPCYNSQMPYGPDVMYINMPLYGTVDSTAIYQDTVDVNSGTLNEGTSVGTLYAPEASPLSNLNSTSDQSDAPDLTRQSSTPVVSLLSLDKQQEKDLTALQGGRRNKFFYSSPYNKEFNVNGFNPVYTSSNNYNNAYSQNKYNNAHPSYPNSCLPCTPPPNDYSSRFPPNPSNCSARFRNFNKNVRHSWYSGRYRHNTTDCNSSSSVDENRNEKHKTLNTAPPASHSTIRHYGNMNNNNNTDKHLTRNFQNSKRPYSLRGRFSNFNNNDRFGSYNRHTLNNYNNRYSTSVHSAANKSYKQIYNFSSNRNKLSSNNDQNNVDSADSTDINSEKNSIADDHFISEHPSDLSQPVSPLPSQITPTTQNCIPTARRIRRNVRRSTHAGASMTEIGAGDAPIPSTDVGDTCKKLDNLNL